MSMLSVESEPFLIHEMQGLSVLEMCGDGRLVRSSSKVQATCILIIAELSREAAKLEYARLTRDLLHRYGDIDSQI